MKEEENNQKGFALLVTMLVLTLLIVIIFHLSRQSFLDRVSFKDEKTLAQTNENYETVIGLIPSIMKRNPQLTTHSFNVEEYQIELTCHKQSQLINLNDLRNKDLPKEMRRKVFAKLNEQGLKDLYPQIMEFVNTSQRPIYTLKQLPDSSFTPDDILDLEKVFSTHSGDCIVVDVVMEKEEKMFLAEATYALVNKDYICKQVRYGFEQKQLD